MKINISKTGKMEEIQKQIVCWTACCLVLFILAVISAPSALAASDAAVYSEEKNITIGEEIYMPIKIDSSKEIYAFQFILKYDPQALEILDVREGDFLKKDGNYLIGFKKLNSTAGIIDFSRTRTEVENGIKGSGNLSVLRLKGKAAGNTIVIFQKLDLVQYVDSEPMPVRVSHSNPSVDVIGSGCTCNNPSCGTNFTCNIANNSCILKIGCDYNNPPCTGNYTCKNNQCVLRPGCAYNSSICNINQTCSSNICIPKTGCAYNNPPCDPGYRCNNNVCERIYCVQAGEKIINRTDNCCVGLTKTEYCEGEGDIKCVAPSYICLPCGDRICDSKSGENYKTCPIDCPDRNKPVIVSKNPAEENVKVSNTESKMFNVTAVDKEVAKLIYTWFLDGKQSSTGQSYLFYGNQNNIGKHLLLVKVSDRTFETDASWNVYVEKLRGCAYNEPPCEINFTCKDNVCIPKTGCAYNNPPCNPNQDCVNNQCVPKAGCQYNNPPCNPNQECANNICVPKAGCAYNNPPCTTGYKCVNNACVPQQGCSFNDLPCPSGQTCYNNKCWTEKPGCNNGAFTCSPDQECVDGNCILKKGCQYNNPSCNTGFNCIANICIPIAGCKYNNPPCNSDSDCVDNACVRKSGCAYSNPPCDLNKDCINNICVSKKGCQYNNPVCDSGFVCANNKCVMIPSKPNSPPVIKSITPDGNVKIVEGALQMSAVAYDPDGDILQYTWWLDGSSIYKSNHFETALKQGSHKVRLDVSDGKGGRVTKTINVEVIAAALSGGIDLSIRDIKASQTAPGMPVKINAVIENTGDKDADNIIWAFEYGSIAVQRSPRPISIKAHSSKQVNIMQPFDIVEEKTIRFTADPDNTIPESDESNNQKTTTINII
ncbi:MAG: CARDB domain-containing protein [Nanoarchaeota archaeon]|nr:CARDB domain-containing protein [Nanoarchaeota archaeon]